MLNTNQALIVDMPQIETLQTMPDMSVAAHIERRNAIVRLVKSSMKEGTDYGVVPGTDKKTLYKPGAEKLCTFFGLSWRLVQTDATLDWTGKDHDGEPFFFFSYRCELRHGGQLVGESDGSCNSWEKKYRWREGKRVCPKCGKEAIFRSKPRGNEPKDKPMGWYCWLKKGGCGATFQPGDKAIESQQVGMVKNDEVHDLVNTIQKMAEKRAFVGSTVLAVNASEFFSSDLDEIDYAESDLAETGTGNRNGHEETPAEREAKIQAGRQALYPHKPDIETDPSLPKCEQLTNPPESQPSKQPGAPVIQAPTIPDYVQLIMSQVDNQGGKLEILPNGKLHLGGTPITPTLLQKVKDNGKAIAEALKTTADQAPF